MTDIDENIFSNADIRPATMADLDDIAHIEEHVFELPFTQSELESYIDRGVLKVAEVNGAVVGFIAARYEKEYYDLTLGGKGDHWIIDDIAVIEGRRNEGIGAALLGEIKGLAKLTNAFTTVNVRDSNKSAQQFFETHDFEMMQAFENRYIDTMEQSISMLCDTRRPKIDGHKHGR